MSDDGRPVEDYAAAIAEIREESRDRLSTIEARLYQRPTGAVDVVFRGTPQPGTLFMQGQTLNRADYPALWAWAQASGSVVAGGYTAGNGSTTFTLPDPRDRFLAIAGGAIVLGGTGGAASRTLTTANMPPHDHNVTNTLSHTPHGHATFANGQHNGHGSGGTVLVPSGSFYGVLPGEPDLAGSHNHDLSVETLGQHTINESTVGSGTSFDNRPPYLGINLAVWT